MANRREFSRAVRVEIVKRATREIGTGKRVICCEECGLVDPKSWHVDHTIPDALFLDKSRPLTAADGKVLCAGSRESCHGRKTAEEDVPTIARCKSVEASHLRVAKPVGPQPEIRSAPMATTPKAAARAKRGHRPSLPPYLPRGFVSATER